jgi:hypothetical protein
LGLVLALSNPEGIEAFSLAARKVASVARNEPALKEGGFGEMGGFL